MTRKRINGEHFPPTQRQLLLLRVIRREEQETGEGARLSALTRMVGKGTKSLLGTLRDKCWVENDGRRWFLTDEGVDQVDNSQAPEFPLPSRKLAVRKPQNRYEPRIPDEGLPPVHPNHWVVAATAVVDAVADKCGLTRAEVLSRSGTRRTNVVRREVIFRLRSELGLSFSEIAMALGRHSSSAKEAYDRFCAEFQEAAE